MGMFVFSVDFLVVGDFFVVAGFFVVTGFEVGLVLGLEPELGFFAFSEESSTKNSRVFGGPST